MARLSLAGALRLSEPGKPRKSAGRFSVLINKNTEVFRRYFGADVFPGSLKLDVPKSRDLQAQLDCGNPPPLFVIPRDNLVGMPDYIGDGQAWECMLDCHKIVAPLNCWLFRRIGSRVPPGVIEVVAREKLVEPYGLRDGDLVAINLV